MLVHGLLHTPLLEQGVVAAQLHHLAQVIHDLRAPAVAAGIQQELVESLVRGKELVDQRGIARQHDELVAQCFQLVVQPRELLQLRLGGRACHICGGVRLQQTQQVVDLAHLVFRNFRYIGTTPHLDGDHAFGCQHLDGLAHGRAADAHFLGQLHFIDPRSRHQLLLQNALTQQIRDFRVEGACRARPDIGTRALEGAGRALHANVKLVTVTAGL